MTVVKVVAALQRPSLAPCRLAPQDAQSKPGQPRLGAAERPGVYAMFRPGRPPLTPRRRHENLGKLSFLGRCRPRGGGRGQVGQLEHGVGPGHTQHQPLLADEPQDVPDQVVVGVADPHPQRFPHTDVAEQAGGQEHGREVNTSGDGFLAMFDGPQRAIRDAVQALGIHVRAGLHTGEWEVRGDDIGGIGVHIGARVSARAGPNEVLVSSTLRDLVIGSGLEFVDRGAHELKGVPGEWRLFAVASR